MDSFYKNSKDLKDAGIKAPTGTFFTDYYKGMVAIPIVDDASVRAATIEGHGLTTPKTDVGAAKVLIQSQFQGRQLPSAGAAQLLSK